MLGGIITAIAPSAIALSAYLCFSDSLLILQCWYYTSFSKRKHPASHRDTADEDAGMDISETENLIQDDNNNVTRRTTGAEPSAIHSTASSPTRRTWIFNAVFIIGVYLVGFVAWLISQSASLGSGSPHSNVENEAVETSTTGVVLGYLGAMCYLG